MSETPIELEESGPDLKEDPKEVGPRNVEELLTTPRKSEFETVWEADTEETIVSLECVEGQTLIVTTRRVVLWT